MDTYDMPEAESDLSRLIEKAARGEPFVIARAGKPIVKVVPLDAPAQNRKSRIGFLEGKIDVPDDFKEIGREEIERMFYGDPDA